MSAKCFMCFIDFFHTVLFVLSAKAHTSFTQTKIVANLARNPAFVLFTYLEHSCGTCPDENTRTHLFTALWI